MRSLAMILTASLAVTAPASARQTAQRPAQQAASRVGPRAMLPLDEEIALARSAAPPQVSDSAAILVLTPAGWSLALHGANGVVCHVNRSWVDSIEPHCYDAEGAATIMQIEMHRTWLYHQGRSVGDADREIAAGLADGTFRLPRRPAMTYMLSAAQKLIGDDGVPAGSWRPHLMIYYPWLTGEDMGLAGQPDLRGAIVNDPGKPTANVMIIAREFIQPRPAKK
jgi:hypothetical protein